MLIILVFTIFIVIMKFKSFQDNSDSILIGLKDTVLRCDIHQRSLDLLYIGRHSHKRVLKSRQLQDIATCDLENLLQHTNRLIWDFSIIPYHIINVYRHDRNDRFVLMEARQSLRLELDKELNGIRDCSSRSYSNMYKRKPDNYYKASVIKEYLRIHQEIKRTFDHAVRMIKLNPDTL
ncbi:MAG: hypothetical protein DHS20C17_25100 [Cyclobacteriaceae bacterium]|nr:MAG: hypothetical protein DHS20C17_25100 [Cyclobacteriaceae bacterium]